MLNINNYIGDGFEKVCDVSVDRSSRSWFYKNIDEGLMYSSHNSWVYFIVSNSTIVKCGESGNPLGIKEAYYYGNREAQPIASSKCRFGRLRRGDSTDGYIRDMLNGSIGPKNTVSLWAKKCAIITTNANIGGVMQQAYAANHKCLELLYLNHFKNNTGGLPWLNKVSK